MRRREMDDNESLKRSFKINIPNRRSTNDWRFLFGNINTLGNYNNRYNDMKWDQLKYIIDEVQPDILGMSEHNRVISRMSRENRPQEVMGVWQPRTVCRFSWLHSTANTTSYEVGGTGIITSGKGSTHTISYGEDKYGLGRWNWVSLQGKKNKITTVISIYRPGKNQVTLDRQHAHTSKMRPNVAKTIGPQKLWDNDLRDLIKCFKDKRHELIVSGDWNDDLNNDKGDIRTLMTSMGLIEPLLERYGPGPETFHTGTTTIDGVFITGGIRIQQGGYTSHEASPGDHRWIWIDVTEQDLLERNRDDHAPPIERRATAKVPSVRHKFNALLETEVHNHNLHVKMEDLYSRAQTNRELSKEDEELYDSIEERIKRSVKFSDNNCRKVRRGNIPFSVTAQNIMRKLRLIKIIHMRGQMKGKQGRPRMRKLRRLARKYHYNGPLQYDTIKASEEALKQARIEYSEFKPRAQDLRENYLYSIAQERSEEDPKGKSVEWHHKKLAGEERIKQHFKHIRKYEGKANRKGVDKVDIQNYDGSTTTVHDRETIAEHIMRANIEKRQQARNTPCRMEPLSQLLGEQMEYSKWEQILAGAITLPDEGIEEGTRLWYNMVSAPVGDSFDITWTTEEYIDSWKKMEETKSSIPGIHTVHMKCLDPHTKAAEVLSRLALIPLLTGYAPKSWMEGIDSMIPKKVVGECRPDKLRLILLFDARFNHNNKLIGKK
jgi:hypothetical protein